jgi:hypothetical protein
LARPGLPALPPDAYAALEDASRWAEGETAVYGSDEMQRWERLDGWEPTS